MEQYLRWRFLRDCYNKYKQYCDEWMNNVTPSQMEYFKQEKERLIMRGIYKE